MNYTARFWRETERYHHLVEDIDQRFYIDSPEYVTTDRLLPDFISYDDWAATAIKYPSLRH